MKDRRLSNPGRSNAGSYDLVRRRSNRRGRCHSDNIVSAAALIHREALQSWFPVRRRETSRRLPRRSLGRGQALLQTVKEKRTWQTSITARRKDSSLLCNPRKPPSMQP
jgi:GAF domain-containing protein